MASSLAELQYREKTLTDKLTRLLNLESMMNKDNPSLRGDITMTKLNLDEVRKKINDYTNR